MASGVKRPFTLSLVTEDGDRVLCPACKGTGKELNEDFQLRSGKWVRGGGYIPCPSCNGSKMLPATVTNITTLVKNDELKRHDGA
jgi:hypothetical protein